MKILNKKLLLLITLCYYQTHASDREQVGIYKQKPSLILDITESTLVAGIKYAYGLKDKDKLPSEKEAAVNGFIKGLVQGLRQVYIILNHLQS